jgi:beta-phosphoglucomutase family hydrolase
MEPARTPAWGAIFDWDGVVIDSSKAHEESWVRLAAEAGRTLPPDHFVRGFGRKNEFIIPEILGWTQEVTQISDYSLRKEALYREVVQERGQPSLPGAHEWLERLAAAGIPCAVGSSTHRANIEMILELIGLRPFFRAIVTSEDVQEGKPHPDVFLTAARQLGLPPGRCVVFEDAHVGIAAARAGGMKVVAVATTNPIEDLTKADLAVHRLDELSVDQVAALLD